MNPDGNFTGLTGMNYRESSAVGNKIHLRWQNSREVRVKLTTIEVIYSKISELL